MEIFRERWGKCKKKQEKIQSGGAVVQEKKRNCEVSKEEDTAKGTLKRTGDDIDLRLLYATTLTRFWLDFCFNASRLIMIMWRRKERRVSSFFFFTWKLWVNVRVDKHTGQGTVEIWSKSRERKLEQSKKKEKRLKEMKSLLVYFIIWLLGNRIRYNCTFSWSFLLFLPLFLYFPFIFEMINTFISFYFFLFFQTFVILRIFKFN